jgi:ketosteroid isomerase-like protein
MLDAMNRHDIDAFVACFDTDYSSEQPAHPGRTFRGSD